MTYKKQTMYEILEVSSNASLLEIKVAHKLLIRTLVTEKLDLRREEIDLKLQMLDLAFNSLSDQASREAYDAQLSMHQTPVDTASPPNTNAVLRGTDSRSLMIAAAIENIHGIAAPFDRMSASVGGGHLTPWTVMSTTVISSVSSLGKILRIIIGFLVLFTVIYVIALGISGNLQQERPAGAVSKAEEQLIIQHYYQEHGVRPGSREEVDLLEIENRRKVNEQRAAALEQQEKDEEQSRFVEESRRMGAQVSYNLERAEAEARDEAEQEKQRSQQEKIQKIQEEEAEQEAERERIAEARRKLGLN